MPQPRSEIAQLRNLGARSEAWLNSVGIYSRADLEHVGPVLAFRMIQDQGYGPSLNLLYAMVGALRDEPWTALTPHEKAKLREAVGN